MSIEGRRLDTDKAKKVWSLDYHDGHNLHTGELYLSSKGTWYCCTPSQWSNGHRWEIGDPAVLVEQYGRGLSDVDKAVIFSLAGLETE